MVDGGSGGLGDRCLPFKFLSHSSLLIGLLTCLDSYASLGAMGVHVAVDESEMSYGAPWEQGVGAAGTMPQCDMEAPGPVPDVSEIGLNTKEARKRRS